MKGHGSWYAESLWMVIFRHENADPENACMLCPLQNPWADRTLRDMATRASCRRPHGAASKRPSRFKWLPFEVRCVRHGYG